MGKSFKPGDLVGRRDGTVMCVCCWLNPAFDEKVFYVCTWTDSAGESRMEMVAPEFLCEVKDTSVALESGKAKGRTPSGIPIY
jgi:hypothetical protein